MIPKYCTYFGGGTLWHCKACRNCTMLNSLQSVLIFLVKIFKTLSLDFFLKRKYTLEYYNFLLTITVPTNQPSLPLSSSSLTLVTTILLSRKVDDFFYLHIQLKLHSSLLPFASLISLNVIISILMEAGFFSWLNSMHVSVSLLIITNWWKYRYSWPLWIVLQ